MAKEMRNNNINFEVRQLGEGENKVTHVQGYALTFEQLSEDMGFREIIRKGALDNCKMDNVVLNINHDMDKPLARNRKTEGIGSLKLTVDENGLFFDAIPTNTSYSRDLLANMESGIIDKCSFAFSMNWEDDEAQEWEWDTEGRGYDLRYINRINELFDVSIVTNPAYESTSCTSYKRAKEEQENEIKRQKLKLELDLL